MKRNDKIEAFFPGFTKKSVTFTIDDGNIPLDKKFIEIVKPHGIIGTFNLCQPNRTSAEEYRELYSGFEIANHCKHHPYVFLDEQKYVISEDEIDRLNSPTLAGTDRIIYKTEYENLYFMHSGYREKPNGWVHIADAENYFKFSNESKQELEEIFGTGSVKSFVWPYFEQPNTKLFEMLKSAGYNSIRKTGAVGATTNFAPPSDRMRWSYNATNKTLLEYMAEYEKLEDDGELKFFAFGVHSHDFENDNNWCDLVEFAKKYGNRPNDFYYASVSDIFEYEDAVKSLEITEKTIKNPSEITVYLKINGEKTELLPGCTLSIS